MSKILEQKAKEAISLIQTDSIYFAHPIDIYNTPVEQEFIGTISHKLPQFRVYSPNQPHNGENYKLWKQETGNGMRYFYDVILPNMEAGIFLPFEDGMFGAGVFNEAEFLKKQGSPLWLIDWNKTITKIDGLDESKKLSVDETRARVYGKK